MLICQQSGLSTVQKPTKLFRAYFLGIFISVRTLLKIASETRTSKKITRGRFYLYSIVFTCHQHHSVAKFWTEVK